MTTARDTLHDMDELVGAYEVVLIDVAAADYVPSPALRGISFGVAGALKVDTKGSSGVVIPSGALAEGVIHPLHITKVYQAGTTASSIVGYR
jgi:hypothetical protein